MPTRREFVTAAGATALAVTAVPLTTSEAKKTPKRLPTLGEVKEFIGIPEDKTIDHWTELCPQDCPKIKETIAFEERVRAYENIECIICVYPTGLQSPRVPCWGSCKLTLARFYADQIKEEGCLIHSYPAHLVS